MAERTEISWADSTFNPWIGCTKVSPGCDHCYAERDMDLRRGRAKWGPGQPRSRTSADYWKQPLRWNREAWWSCPVCGWRGPNKATSVGGLGYAACPVCPFPRTALELARRRVFCASLADVFDNEVDPSWRRDLFDLIRATPNLDWLLLTKRIGLAERMAIAASTDPENPWPENVWLGATVVNQEEVDRDVPKLLATSARVRFLSIEPMLGPITLDPVALYRWIGDGTVCAEYLGPRVHWVICGGESGPQARPIHPDWVRSLRDQCAGADVPFLWKQWGEFVSVSEVAGAGPHVQFHDGATVRRVGKKAAGRLLDGVEHNGYPGAQRGA